MKVLRKDKAIDEFLELSEKFHSSELPTGQVIFDNFAAWYRDTRIDNAIVSDMDDMVLVQWGSIQNIILDKPTDLRRLKTQSKTRYSELKSRYLSFTRQIYTHDEDIAVELCISLGFGPETGTECGYSAWIDSPNDISSVYNKITSYDLPKSLFPLKPETITAYVGDVH